MKLTLRESRKMEMGRRAMKRLCPAHGIAAKAPDTLQFLVVSRALGRGHCSLQPLLPGIDPRFVMFLALRDDRSDLRWKIALQASVPARGPMPARLQDGRPSATGSPSSAAW